MREIDKLGEGTDDIVDDDKLLCELEEDYQQALRDGTVTQIELDSAFERFLTRLKRKTN